MITPPVGTIEIIFDQGILRFIMDKTRWRFCCLFTIVLFFCAGLRGCDNTVTLGFPTIAWEFAPNRIWIPHLTNVAINLIFAIFVLWFVLQLTNTRYYRESQHFRWGMMTAFAYLIYATLTLPLLLLISHHPASNDFLEFLQMTAVYPVFIPFLLESKFFTIFFGHNFLEIPNEKFRLVYPLLSSFYPHIDDMLYRLNVAPALTLVFSLGFGVSKFKSWMRKK